MRSQKTDVVEDITVSKEFVDVLKCSIEDIWSDDDDFFDINDPLRADLRNSFKYYNLVLEEPVTHLCDTEKVEQINKNCLDVVERKTKNKCRKTCKSNKKSYRSETFILNDTAEQCSNVSTKSDVSNNILDVHFSSSDKEYSILTSGDTEEVSGTELGGHVSDNSICQEIKGIQKKAIQLEKVKCNEIFHLQDSNRKLITFLNDETVGLNDTEYADVVLSEDYNKSIMSVTSDDLRKPKKRKREVSVSDGSDISISSKQHCNRDKHKVEHTVSNSDSDSRIEKLNSDSEKIDTKISVRISAENNKVSRSLEDSLSRRDCRSEWQSGKNSEESHNFSKYSFISKESSVNTQKRDSVKCIMVSDTSDEDRSCVVNSEKRKKRISRFVSKKLREEEDNMIFSEEVTSDDEAWVTQAPKNMNIDSLFGQSIKLNENFLLRDNNGKVYEGFVSPAGNKRNASLVIPSVKTKSLQLRALPLAGSIIIEEKVNVPHATTLMLHKKKKTPLPQGLRQRHPLLGTGFEDLSKPADFCHGSLHKKEKKKGGKKISLGATTDKISHTVNDESDIYSGVEKKKKKKRKHEDLVVSGTDDMYNINIINESELSGALKQKKKVKHSNIIDVATGSVMTELESDSFVKKEKKDKVSDINETGTEMVDTATTELGSDSSLNRKKKKKKHSDISEAGTEIIGTVTTELEAKSSIKKKKKDSGINEVATTDLNSDNFVNKKKKKKHIDMHDTGTEIVDNFTTELGQ